MQMTGHKTRSVFERYNIVSPGDLRDAARSSMRLPGTSVGTPTSTPSGTPRPKRPVAARRCPRKLWKALERETGIEPATSSLGSLRSTAELLPLRSTGVGHNRRQRTPDFSVTKPALCLCVSVAGKASYSAQSVKVAANETLRVQPRMIDNTSSRLRSINSGVAASRFNRSSGSVFEALTLKCQSG